MYKDKEKQKEANRRAQAKFKAKGITEGITRQGITDTKRVIPTGTKRGKDIKCFEDLHPDIQVRIRELSDTNEEFKRRVAIAINYQHLFPDRYEPKEAFLSTNYQLTPSEQAGYKPANQLAPATKTTKAEVNHVSKPGDADYNGVCTPEWIKEKRRVDRAEDAAGRVHRHEARP